MVIWHISDTHGMHNYLTVPKGIDMIIHSGDASNYMDPIINHNEMWDFKEWWNNLEVKYKIYVAGNHDTSIEKGIFSKNNLENNDNSFYLENDEVEIEGLKFYGSPYQPLFGNWSFQRADNKLFKMWENIPEDTDILITHGPPKGILDLAENRDHKLEYCGDKHLFNRVMQIKPKYHLFGHIHNNGDQINEGMRMYESITFVNSSCVTDRKFKFGPTSEGNIIEII